MWPMFAFKLGLLTCAFYLAICAIIDLAISLTLRFSKVSFIGLRGWPGFLVLFGSIWLVSFYCAARIFMADFRAQFPH